MSQSGPGNIVSKTHAHHAQSHSPQSAHGNGFMPMQALPPPSLPRSMPSYYMSVYIEGGQVFASTVVRYHNKLGVVYFNLIRPFHVLVVKNLFKQMMRERGF